MTDAQDCIHIRGLKLRCFLGTKAHERRRRQGIVVSLTLYADLSCPCRTDRLDDTIDYEAVAGRIAALVRRSQFHLVERLAEAIAAVCLEDSMVSAARVIVEKPAAIRSASAEAVEIVRRRRKTRRVNLT